MQDSFFNLMAIGFKIRDFFRPRDKIIADIGIKPGDGVLDYGCGPGSYILPVYRLAGEAGKIYAADINPLAIKYVKDLSLKKGLPNVTTIQTGSGTGLPDNSMDVVLLYDILHGLDDVEPVFRELHRVMKPGGILSVNDHHLQEGQIIQRVTQPGLFAFSCRTSQAISFTKI
jgi:ubiquinone/menaquinone biosynthesis C-methylase UbiE